MGEVKNINKAAAERIKKSIGESLEHEKPGIVQVMVNGVLKEKTIHAKKSIEQNVTFFNKATKNKGSLDLFRNIRPGDLVKKKEENLQDDGAAHFPCMANHKNFITYKFNREKMISI